MALKLRSSGILSSARRALSGEGARSAVTVSTAAGVGLALGNACASDGRISEPVRKYGAEGALGAGLVTGLLGLSAVGDGVASAGATMIGYRMGAKGDLGDRSPVMPRAPRLPASATAPSKKR